jgi:hypothetical protein
MIYLFLKAITSLRKFDVNNAKITLIIFCLFFQDIPLHVILITHLLIAWDRYRWLTYPLKTRLPAFVCSCASWLTAIIIALPYPIYMTFIDLGVSLSPFYYQIHVVVETIFLYGRSNFNWNT